MGEARKVAGLTIDQSKEQKKEVILEAQKEQRTVHFASLMDIRHLKNAELEPKLQKYKGRVVLRGDIVKDDSGAHAVFTEQGSSASQMTAAKEMDVIAKITWLLRKSSWCSFRVHSSKIGGRSQIAQNSKVRMSRYLDTSSTT